MKTGSKVTFQALARVAVAAAVLAIPLSTVVTGCGEKKSEPAKKTEKTGEKKEGH